MLYPVVMLSLGFAIGDRVGEDQEVFASETHGKITNTGFPDDLMQIHFCEIKPDSGRLEKFSLGAFSVLTYDGKDCTGSAWEKADFATPDVIAKMTPYYAPLLANTGEIMTHFAFVDPGCYSDHGGFVYRSNDIFGGASEICPEGADDAGTYFFHEPQYVSSYPHAWVLGRMTKIKLPELADAGATYFTYVTKEEAKRDLGVTLRKSYEDHSWNHILTEEGKEPGGFLYRVGKTAQEKLVFFQIKGMVERTATPAPPEDKNTTETEKNTTEKNTTEKPAVTKKAIKVAVTVHRGNASSSP